MKDLIAKLQLDANCALGAIWMHIDAQSARIAELESEVTRLSASWRGDATVADALEERVAELEAQIAAAPVPVVEQQPLGYIPKWAHDMLTGEMGGMSDWGCNAHIYAAEAIGHIPIYTASRITDTDKLRDAILALRVDPPRRYDNAQISAFCLGAKVMSEAAADLAASTALQAPVREVPGWKMIPIEPTPEIVKAMAESQAVDDEGEFPSLHDLIDFSGENKTQAAIKAAYRAMISASPLPTMPVRDAWQPIETAPKDGTDILICQAWDASGNPMCENSHALFTQRASWWTGENGGNGSWIVYNSMVLDPECFFEPTHWMPVPSISVAASPIQPDTGKEQA